MGNCRISFPVDQIALRGLASNSAGLVALTRRGRVEHHGYSHQTSPESIFTPMPITPTSYATLTAMLTPAIFMTANGSLIISTSNRMSRVVDRIRVLNDRGDELCRGGSGLDFVEERRAHVADQLGRLEWRSDRVRYALTMLYLAFASFVGTSLTLAIDTLIGNRLEAVPTALSVLGVGLLLMASVNLIREARAALASNRLEIAFYRDLQARRVAEGRCSGG
jgi:hypothetical protein